jgi:hypothetical protein
MQTIETAALADITADQILDDLLKFVNRRTNMDIRNYAKGWSDMEGLKTFRSEYREILRDGRDARTMILASRHVVPAAVLLLQGRTNERLTYGSNGFDYCVGQDWCTEYRAAACWYLRRCYEETLMAQGCSCGEIQQLAKREFGLGIARRWFSYRGASYHYMRAKVL